MVGAVLALVLSALFGAVFAGQASAETASSVVLGRAGCSSVEDREDRRQCRRGEGREIVLPPLNAGDLIGPGESARFRGSCEPGETGAAILVRAFVPGGGYLDAKRSIRIVRSSYNPKTLAVTATIRNTTRKPVNVSVNGACVGDPTT
jgi:hypothetical protein